MGCECNFAVWKSWNDAYVLSTEMWCMKFFLSDLCNRADLRGGLRQVSDQWGEQRHSSRKTGPEWRHDLPSLSVLINSSHNTYLTGTATHTHTHPHHTHTHTPHTPHAHTHTTHTHTAHTPHTHTHVPHTHTHTHTCTHHTHTHSLTHKHTHTHTRAHTCSLFLEPA